MKQTQLFFFFIRKLSRCVQGGTKVGVTVCINDVREAREIHRNFDVLLQKYAKSREQSEIKVKTVETHTDLVVPHIYRFSKKNLLAINLT